MGNLHVCHLCHGWIWFWFCCYCFFFLTLFGRVLQLGLGQRSHAHQTCTVNEWQPLGPEVRMNKQGINEIWIMNRSAWRDRKDNKRPRVWGGGPRLGRQPSKFAETTSPQSRACLLGSYQVKWSHHPSFEVETWWAVYYIPEEVTFNWDMMHESAPHRLEVEERKFPGRERFISPAGGRVFAS